MPDELKRHVNKTADAVHGLSALLASARRGERESYDAFCARSLKEIREQITRIQVASGSHLRIVRPGESSHA